MKKIDELGNIGNKIANSALKEGAEVVLEQQKKDAPKSDDGDNAADKLLVDKIKKYKNGAKSIKIGITEQNFEDTKHLYFQNYGYEHYKNGERVEVHLGWMEDSFEKVKEKVSEDIKDKIRDEINKIW